MFCENAPLALLLACLIVVDWHCFFSSFIWNVSFEYVLTGWMIVYIPYCITSWHIWYEVTQKMLKVAVCSWLLKGENILPSYTCFSERTILTVSYFTLECVFSFRMPIFVLDCVILPTTILPSSVCLFTLFSLPIGQIGLLMMPSPRYCTPPSLTLTAKMATMSGCYSLTIAPLSIL